MLLDLRRWSAYASFVRSRFTLNCGVRDATCSPYDKNVAEGLTAANTEAMTLMATTSQGTDKSTFSSREEKYNALIGKLDAPLCWQVLDQCRRIRSQTQLTNC